VAEYDDEIVAVVDAVGVADEVGIAVPVDVGVHVTYTAGDIYGGSVIPRKRVFTGASASTVETSAPVSYLNSAVGDAAYTTNAQFSRRPVNEMIFSPGASNMAAVGARRVHCPASTRYCAMFVVINAAVSVLHSVVVSSNTKAYGLWAYASTLSAGS